MPHPYEILALVGKGCMEEVIGLAIRGSGRDVAIVHWLKDQMQQ